MNCGTGETGETSGTGETGETSGTGETGETSGTGENFELGTSCKLAPAVRLVGLMRVRAKASEGLELGMWG